MEMFEQFLWAWGVTPRYRGFKQATLAFSLIIEDEMRLCSIVKDVYMPVAETCGCTWYAVERNIRSLILHIWENEESRAAFTAFSGYTQKPSISDFMDILFYRITQMGGI